MVAGTCKALAILICALTAVSCLAAERTFDKHFNAPPGGKLTVDAESGSVTVAGQDTRELIVHADMMGSSEDLARLDLSAVQDAAGVTVTEQKTRRSFLDWLGFNLHPARVRFTIEVPRDYAVDIHTSGGNLDVSHLKASLRGRTFGGSISIRDVLGPIDTHTFGGSINAEELNGSTELHTFGGDISVAHCRGDLTVRTAGGSISLDDIDGRVIARTSGGSVTARMRTNRGISLKTAGGSITLLLPTHIRASIDAHTIGGTATSAIPLTSVQVAPHRWLRGDINGGGESVLLRTAGGGIHIAALGS
jgi:hypothetical protein